MENSAKPLLSVVLTVYQGESLVARAIAEIDAHFKASPDMALEIIAVEDGSTDDSFVRLRDLQKHYPKVLRIIQFSRNFGEMAAMQGGVDFARGDCIAMLPKDLQETPQMIADMFRGWREDGIKINLTTRTEERDEPLLKKIPAVIYHKLFRLLAVPDYPPGGFGTFLIDRQVADELKRNPPDNVDLRTYLFSLGFPRRLYPYSRGRALEGKSSWTAGNLLSLAIGNFISFSFVPVRLMSAFGLLVAMGSFVFAAYIFFGKIFAWYPLTQPSGWATIVVLISFFSGVMMMMMGVIGEYLWRILDVARRRPRYLVHRVIDKIEE